MNFRSQAQQALIRLCAHNLPLPDGFNHWSSQSKNLVLQSCRYYYQLRCIIHYLSSNKIKDPEIWTALILGLTELKYLQSPAHAVINEWVSLIKAKHPHAAGLVNAILRRFQREQDQIEADLQTELEFQYAHPLWLIQELQKAWPNDWSKILTGNNIHPPMSLRVNQTYHSPESFLQISGLDAHIGKYSPSCVQLKQARAVTEIMGFAEGWCSVQDEAAQLAAYLLDLKPGLSVLDACAAPGGKTAHILEYEPELATCLALEPDPSRYQRLLSTLARLKLYAQCRNQDATQLTLGQNEKLFDRILVDAPCSGTGVIRRHPDIKLRRNPKELLHNLTTQANLLRNLWPLLAPGGRLLYATCSILPQENDDQIEKFLTEHPDAKTISQKIIAGVTTPHGQQIFPGQNQMDGFYYALLLKSKI